MTELKEQIKQERENVKRFQDYISNDEGMVVSCDTLKTSDLLKKFAGIVYHYRLPFPNLRDLDLLMEEYSDQLDEIENANEVLHELFDYFEDIAPTGFYFSSQEGDGACFGFWKYSEEDLF